ncbi:MAG: alpha-amylase family glycosyl hydrolase [Spirochaetota bacterium]
MEKKYQSQLYLLGGKLSPAIQKKEAAFCKSIREFHISGKARKTYGFDESLFSISGNVIFPDFHASRVFARQMNEKRDLVKFPESAVRAGHINAMGLIDEILHFVIDLYRLETGACMRAALVFLENQLGKSRVDRTLVTFTRLFPPPQVYRGEIEVEEYLAGRIEDLSARELALEEMLLLWLANVNPAFGLFRELFDDTELGKKCDYEALILGLQTFFRSQPVFGPDNQTLIDMLKSPAMAEPYSIPGQLKYIREHWGRLLGKYFFRLLKSLDLIKEEEKISFKGPGPSYVYTYRGLDEEIERFSLDREWMPKVVLIAKSTFVWLDQLSRRYNRPVHNLSDIPDEELDLLSRRGFNALWLIGLWERSQASRQIKRICGNPEAEASAYSLLRYEIAGDLGGWEAFNHLKERCLRRGIRLASDMVPNHTGIDSDWVINHPDWFIQLNHKPFPAYSYNGINLSRDSRVGVFIEDHYYDKTDAAVTFKRHDFYTNNSTYIYHGNDGTSMPWNDTAQLNFLNPDVREAVIQTLLHVARNFPIIRFDAAMTLTKKHFQRLWFPEPGTGGDIATRGEHGITKEEFDAAMPVEFWREVVDRVAAEAPDTLLLAEAFWFMEGYFVRTLGMHRVYNSAFMNMLKNEENAKYRAAIKNTLEFDPDILKRFVNFMNNPDEDTAVAQFGKGDKYFGVCTLMVTMPGLPMFGHGQIEGFTEKYGMEYRKSYWNEQEDVTLAARHEREIFPLLKKRYLFAEVENFFVYDLSKPGGGVNENVFAFSNRAYGERVLVLYNNAYQGAQGWIKLSAVKAVKEENGGRRLIQPGLGDGLRLTDDDGYFCIFQEQRSGLWYIRKSKEIREHGLGVELKGYQCQVFLDFKEVRDDDLGHYSRLYNSIKGLGVKDIDEALKEIFLQPVHAAFEIPVNAGLFKYVESVLAGKKEPVAEYLDDFKGNYKNFMKLAGESTGKTVSAEQASVKAVQSLEAVLKIHGMIVEYNGITVKPPPWMVYLENGLHINPDTACVLAGWSTLRYLGINGLEEISLNSRSLIDDLLLDKSMGRILKNTGVIDNRIEHTLSVIKILTSHQHLFSGATFKKKKALDWMEKLLSDNHVDGFLGVNRFEEILWFNRESFLELAWWLFIASVVTVLENEKKDRVKKRCREIFSIIGRLIKTVDESEYKVEKLLDLLAGKAGKQPDSRDGDY